MTTHRATLAERVESLPSIARRALGRVRRSRRLRRLRRRPRWGNLRRLRPLSDNFGFDRGTPVDRCYLEDFFGRHAADIRGHVLEVGWAEFSEPHGSAVTRRDILDIDPRNDDATIVGDLSEVGSLPAGAFDCALVSQTLQFVPDLDRAVENIWQSLKPDGVALLSIPSISRVAPSHLDIERWRMLPAGLQAFLDQRCPGGEIDVVGYGNVLAATAFLLGIVAEELARSEIDEFDPNFPILACARVCKPAPGS